MQNCLAESTKTIYLASCLYDCIEDGNVRAVKQLLHDNHANPNIIIPDKGITPFHLAIGTGAEETAEEITRLCLQYGGDPNIRSEENLTPVHIAAAWGRIKILRCLLHSGGDLTLTDDRENTPLKYAVIEQHSEVVKFLEEFESSPEENRDIQEFSFNLSFDKFIIKTGAHVAEYNEFPSKETEKFGFQVENVLKPVSKITRNNRVKEWCAAHSELINFANSTLIEHCNVSKINKADLINDVTDLNYDTELKLVSQCDPVIKYDSDHNNIINNSVKLESCNVPEINDVNSCENGEFYAENALKPVSKNDKKDRVRRWCVVHYNHVNHFANSKVIQQCNDSKISDITLKKTEQSDTCTFDSHNVKTAIENCQNRKIDVDVNSDLKSDFKPKNGVEISIGTDLNLKISGGNFLNAETEIDHRPKMKYAISNLKINARDHSNYKTDTNTHFNLRYTVDSFPNLNTDTNICPNLKHYAVNSVSNPKINANDISNCKTDTNSNFDVKYNIESFPNLNADIDISSNNFSDKTDTDRDLNLKCDARNNSDLKIDPHVKSGTNSHFDLISSLDSFPNLKNDPNLKHYTVNNESYLRINANDNSNYETDTYSNFDATYNIDTSPNLNTGIDICPKLKSISDNHCNNRIDADRYYNFKYNSGNNSDLEIDTDDTPNQKVTTENNPNLKTSTDDHSNYKTGINRNIKINTDKAGINPKLKTTTDDYSNYKTNPKISTDDHSNYKTGVNLNIQNNTDKVGINPKIKTSTDDHSNYKPGINPNLKISTDDHSNYKTGVNRNIKINTNKAGINPKIKTRTYDLSNYKIKTSTDNHSNYKTGINPNLKISSDDHSNYKTGIIPNPKISIDDHSNYKTGINSNLKINTDKAGINPKLKISTDNHSNYKTGINPNLKISTDDHSNFKTGVNPNLKTSTDEHSNYKTGINRNIKINTDKAGINPNLKTSTNSHSNYKTVINRNLKISADDHSNYKAGINSNLKINTDKAGINPNLKTSTDSHSNYKTGINPNLKISTDKAGINPNLKTSTDSHSNYKTGINPNLKISTDDLSNYKTGVNRNIQINTDKAGINPKIKTSTDDHSNYKTSINPNSKISIDDHSNYKTGINSNLKINTDKAGINPNLKTSTDGLSSHKTGINGLSAFEIGSDFYPNLNKIGVGSNHNLKTNVGSRSNLKVGLDSNSEFKIGISNYFTLKIDVDNHFWSQENADSSNLKTDVKQTKTTNNCDKCNNLNERSTELKTRSEKLNKCAVNESKLTDENSSDICAANEPIFQIKNAHDNSSEKSLPIYSDTGFSNEPEAKLEVPKSVVKLTNKNKNRSEHNSSEPKSSTDESSDLLTNIFNNSSDDSMKKVDNSRESGILTIPSDSDENSNKCIGNIELNEKCSSSEYLTCESVNTLEKNVCESLITLDLSDKVNKCVSITSDESATNQSYVQTAEEYKYVDNEEGIVLIEKRIFINLKTNDTKSVASSESVSSLPSVISYDTDTLRQELTLRGEPPGPITKTTKRVYLKKLKKLTKNNNCVPVVIPKNTRVYSVELEKTLHNATWKDDLSSYKLLENIITDQFSRADPSKRWREGLTKTSFTYLLLDPRITNNLPGRIEQMSFSESWRTFLAAIFYVGKGKRSRPYSHLYEAVSHWNLRHLHPNPQDPEFYKHQKHPQKMSDFTFKEPADRNPFGPELKVLRDQHASDLLLKGPTGKFSTHSPKNDRLKKKSPICNDQKNPEKAADFTVKHLAEKDTFRPERQRLRDQDSPDLFLEVPSSSSSSKNDRLKKKSPICNDQKNPEKAADFTVKHLAEKDTFRPERQRLRDQDSPDLFLEDPASSSSSKNDRLKKKPPIYKDQNNSENISFGPELKELQNQNTSDWHLNGPTPDFSGHIPEKDSKKKSFIDQNYPEDFSVKGPAEKDSFRPDQKGLQDQTSCDLLLEGPTGKLSRCRPKTDRFKRKSPKNKMCFKKESSRKNSANKKVKYITDIWRDECGVVCLHVFQNVIPVEAYTREAAMINALKLENLCNSKTGDFYGISATWPEKKKRLLGVYLLYRALLIFFSEGERQLRPDDIGA